MTLRKEKAKKEAKKEDKNRKRVIKRDNSENRVRKNKYT